MSSFEIERVIPASTTAVWDVVTDWPRYAEWTPFTTMEQDAGRPVVGWSFAGLTGLGPFRVRDAMTIAHWQPPEGARPGSFRLTKTGRWVGGWAVVSVSPHPTGTMLTWREAASPRPDVLGRVLAPVLDPVVRAVFGRVVDAMARAAVTR